MRTALLTIVMATLLLFVSSVPAGSLNFSANWKIVLGGGALGYLTETPDGDYCSQGCIFNKNTGVVTSWVLPDSIVFQRVVAGVVWTSPSIVFVATNKSVYKMSYPGLLILAVYNKANGYLPSDNCPSIVRDSVNSRLLIGTDSGLAIWTLDASSNVTTKTVALSVKNTAKVLVHGTEIWATSNNQQDVYHYRVSDGWTTSHPSTLGFVGGSGALTLDTAGNAYIATATGVRRYNQQTAVWDSISILSDLLGELIVDRDNNLWFLGNKYFGRMNLSTGNIDTVLISSVSWLSDGTNWAILSLTPDRRILIGGVGAFVEELAPNGIIWHATLHLLSVGNYYYAHSVNVLGRISKSSASGVNLNIYRQKNPDGSWDKSGKSLIQKETLVR